MKKTNPAQIILVGIAVGIVAVGISWYQKERRVNAAVKEILSNPEVIKQLIIAEPSIVPQVIAKVAEISPNTAKSATTIVAQQAPEIIPLVSLETAQILTSTPTPMPAGMILVTVRVRDQDTDEPIVGALLTITIPPGASGVTGADGIVTVFTAVRPSDFYILGEVSYPGYITQAFAKYTPSLALEPEGRMEIYLRTPTSWYGY